LRDEKTISLSREQRETFARYRSNKLARSNIRAKPNVCQKVRLPESTTFAETKCKIIRGPWRKLIWPAQSTARDNKSAWFTRLHYKELPSLFLLFSQYPRHGLCCKSLSLLTDLYSNEISSLWRRCSGHRAHRYWRIRSTRRAGTSSISSANVSMMQLAVFDHFLPSAILRVRYIEEKLRHETLPQRIISTLFVSLPVASSAPANHYFLCSPPSSSIYIAKALIKD
jgi:hypothetical protein